jgi:signal transduction histidine kinase
MRTLRLRTKFLLSLLVISAGLTAELLANVPNVAALMSTHDPATIQDGSANVFRLSGTDLLLMFDPDGQVMAFRSKAPVPKSAEAQDLLRRALGREDLQTWWFNQGRLYQVRVQPIFFGSTQTTLGFLAIGQAIDQQVAQDLGNIANSEVAFSIGGNLVASTFAGPQQAEVARRLPGERFDSVSQREVQLGKERYLTAAVRLSPPDEPPVYLSVFKSFDEASAFLSRLNGILAALGLLSVLAGSLLVFFISDTFTRPLANLVGGVRALESGDFDYPLPESGGDEVAEVTGAFTRMRASLRKTQEDHRQLEERFRQAHKMEAVGRLAGGVAHDFNNLLTVIRGHSDLLLDRIETGSPTRRSAEQILKAADRAVGLTRQLLAFSRMQVLQPSVLDLNAIMNDMGKMLPCLIGEHIEYVFRPARDLGRVKADPGQIEQVIMNLAVNARDAMPEGGSLTVTTINVTVSAREAAKRPPMTPGRYVLLSVADSGHGMDEATKAHIFEPFFTTKEVGKGTGLGLATVYGVFKQSGGFVWVESAPRRGATFDIYLPEAAHEPAAAQPAVERVPIPRGSETIGSASLLRWQPLGLDAAGADRASHRPW